MKIKWIGHSALLLEGSRKVLIDPFLTGNPVSETSVDDITEWVQITDDGTDSIGDLPMLMCWPRNGLGSDEQSGSNQ